MQDGQVLNEVLAEVRRLADEVKTLKQPKAAVVTEEVENVDMEEDWDDEDPGINPGDFQDSEPTWTAIFQQERRHPGTGAGATLAGLMVKPPPLDVLKSPQFSSPNFIGIPQTPAPRKNTIDYKIATAQKKMEDCMQHMVAAMEGDRHGVNTAAALARSAWEDLHQMRREHLAGRQRSKLQKREDDQKPRLLTAEEEAKITLNRGKGKGKGKGFSRDPTSDGRFGRSDSRFGRSEWPRNSNGKGKGRGQRRSSQHSP